MLSRSSAAELVSCQETLMPEELRAVNSMLKANRLRYLALPHHLGWMGIGFWTD